MKRAALRLTLPGTLLAIAVTLPVASGGCDAIVGAGDRKLDPSITCDDTGCECAAGFGDCDDDPDNACETDLNDPDNCGACGNVCANGACENLACACEGTFADCDGDPMTVCETDLAASGEHCGSCGRSCKGQPCEDGLCRPEAVTSMGAVYWFAMDGETIYFAPFDTEGLYRLEPGGAPEPFAAPNQFVFLVQVHGDHVYWSTDTQIFAKPKAGGEDVLIASQVVTDRRMEVAGDKVYWINYDMAASELHLERAPAAGGGMTEEVALLGSSDYVFDFAVTEEHAYWNDIMTLVRVTHDSLTPQSFKALDVTATYMASEPGNLLYAGYPSGTFVVPLSGGAVSQIADVEGIGRLESDSQSVYFVTATGPQDPPKIWRVGKSGGPAPLKLVQDPFAYPFLPLGIGSEYLYWIGSATGAVLRVPK